MQRSLGTVYVREQTEIYAARSLKGARRPFVITLLLICAWLISRTEFLLYVTGGSVLLICACWYFGALVTSLNRGVIEYHIKDQGFDDVTLFRDNRHFTALHDSDHVKGHIRRQDSDHLNIFIND